MKQVLFIEYYKSWDNKNTFKNVTESETRKCQVPLKAWRSTSDGFRKNNELDTQYPLATCHIVPLVPSDYANEYSSHCVGYCNCTELYQTL